MLLIDNPDINTPLENLPKLYQIWGTLWVIIVLLEVANKEGYKVEHQSLVGKDKTGIFVRVFPNGQPAIILTHPQNHTKIKLIPERTYSKTGNLCSTSVTLRPDIALEIEFPDNSYKIYLFDPKYKLESETQENMGNEGISKAVDIQKMHTYHDAIQDSIRSNNEK